MILNIIKSIVFYFVLMYLSVNLLGMLVRGFFNNPGLDKLEIEAHDFIKKEIRKSKKADTWVTITAAVLNIVFFYLLAHFWNYGVVLAALIIITGRLPDLIWDIKHGRKTDPKLMKKGFLFYFSAILPWLAFPVLYYSLYY